jgi:ABC-2 type transport system permease protein
MSRSIAIVIRQFYLFRGSPARFVSLFAWIVIDIVLWGFMSRYLNSIASPGFDFVPALLGAVLLWDFFNRVMQGVTMAFFEDVWTRNFLNIFASPMSIREYVGGLVLSSIATSSAGLLVMIVLAAAVFGLPASIYGFMIVPFVFVLFLFGIALGIVASGLVLYFGPAAEWFVWPIPAVISPFAGVFYPIVTLPAWMQAVSLIVPPSYVFEGLRVSVRGDVPPAHALLICVALTIAYLAAASWIFARIYKHAVRTGQLARYTAETLS